MRYLRAGAALIGLAICCGAAQLVAAEDAPPDAAAAPPVFRRIFIPADEIDNRQWAGRYFSVNKSEFEQLLKTVYDAARGAPGAQRDSLQRADYQARIVDDDLLVGSATLLLERGSDEPTLLPLDPCSVALESAHWPGPMSAKPAVWGADPEGRPTVLVEGSKLECRWSQRGERTASGAVTFRLDLPGCPMTRLVVDAPTGQQVVADKGIVSKSAADGQSARWTIESGGHNRITLRIVPAGAGRPLTLLRQSISYEFSPRGINVTAQLALDVHGEPLERATIDVDPALHLVAAQYGQQPVPWLTTTDAETGQLRVLLEFPEPVEGTGRVLQLSAVAPLTIGDRLRLPGLQPQNMAWQEATAELLIPDALVLEQLLTDGCRQSRVTALPAPLAGESIEIQYYEPGATIDVLVAEPRNRPSLERGTLVEVGPDEITSRSAMALDVPPDEQRRVRIPIRAPWTIDTVENFQSNRPLEWDIDERPGKPAELLVELRAPGRLVVRGHRAPPSGEAFDAAALAMLDFSEFDNAIKLISVRAAEGSELRWSGSEEINRHDTVNLDAQQQQLFALPPDAVVFSDDDSFAQARLAVERRRPTYAADIYIDAAVQQDTLGETYTIQCVPDSARVERLLVHFSEARDVPLEWNLAGGNSGQFSARKLSSGEQAKADLPPGGEVWELLLQLDRPGAFELRGQRTIPFTSQTALALVSVHDATTQRGTLAIRALGDTGLSIENRRLLSVPAELLEPDRYQTVRATYHYQPSADDLGAEPAVRIAPADPQQAETGAWAWNLRLESRFAIDGTCVHQATFRIQTAGRRQLRLVMPAGATLHSAWLDEKRLAPALEETAGDGRLIELSSGRSRATLSLYFSTPASLPALAARQAPPFPSLGDVPILVRQWSIWLPPGYEITDADARTPVAEVAPPSWSERLFGPLGRGASGHIFNPLVTSDWRETFLATNQARQSRDDCQRLVRNLGTLLGEYANDEGLSWGQALALASEAERALGRALLVDTESLNQLGLTPASPVDFELAHLPLERGLELLRRANLVAVAAPGVVLLTSATGAAAFREQLQSPPASVIYTVADGALARELRSAARGTQWSRFASVDLWRAGVLGESPAWVWPDEPPMTAGDPRGWTNYQLQCSATREPHVRIVQKATVRSLCWAIFLAITGIGLWRPQAKYGALVALLAVAAAAALVLPPAFAPLASAAMLGGCLCLAVRLTHIEVPSPTVPDRSHGSRRVRSSVVQQLGTLLLMGAVFNAAAALAAEPDAKAPPATPDAKAPIYSVFVPVDADQEPTGGHYYVPDELYKRLLQKTAAISGRPNDWIVTRGTYQGTLSRDPVTSRLGLAGLKARFDLHVFQANVPVRLPIPRASWGDLISEARLDGRVTPLVWSAAGDALILDSMAAEPHRVELDLKPSVPADAADAGFDLPIPKLAHAILKLTMPPDGPPIELLGARGQVNVDKERGELTAQLGASRRLSVRWPTGEGADAAPANLEVEELIWMKVRPGTTVLDARFKFRVLSGRIGELRLLTDPRLSLLSSPSSLEQVSAVHTIPGDPQRIELELAHDVVDEVAIDLSFLVTGTSGVGNLRLPRKQATGARAARRWLGVSVDRALQPNVQAGEDSRVLEINDFLSAWGTADAKPYAAYSISRGEPVWVLSTQPSKPRVAVDQSLALSLGRNTAQVRFDAEIAVTRGVLVQLGLQAPPNIVVDQISVLEDDVQRVARWSVGQDGRISVFLTAPLEGRQQLTFRGRWVPEASDAFEVPRLRVLSADVKNDELQLYRQSAVLVTVEKPPGVKELDARGETPQAGFGSLVGRYALDEAGGGVGVKLAPNDPRLHALAMTIVEREDDHWMAELYYHVEVLGGLADTLRFEIPPQWSEPLRIEPTMRYEIVSIPGEHRRQLVVYPDRPLSGEQQIRIRGRVAPSPGDRLSVPDVVPLRVRQFERFITLPRHLESQQVTWDRLGLQPAKAPAEFASTAAKAQSTAVYKVAGEHFQASLKAVQHASAVARVDLVDIQLGWHPDGGYQAVAAFDIEPGGSTRCVLELPAGCRLVHATVEQLPALLSKLAENRWQLGLGPQQLPQRIEVVYTASASDPSPPRQLQAPRLVDLEVGQTLWTIYSPPRLGAVDSRLASRVSPAELQLKRLNTIADLVELPAEVVGEHLPEEIARWYGSWRNQYWSARQALRWDLIATGRQGAQSEENIVAGQLDERMRTVDERLGATRAGLRQLPAADASTQFAALARTTMRPTHFAGDQAVDVLQVRYPPAGADHFIGRLLAGIAMLLVGGLAAWWLRGRTLPTFAPWIIVSVAGFAWWLLLAPSFLGLLALAMACSAAIWSRWRGAFRPQLS